MKRGSEIGLATIKCKSKEGCDSLKDIHYKINDILYKYNKRYISRLDAIDIQNQLTTLGIALKNTDVYPKAASKKTELLNQTRTITKQVREYAKNFQWKYNDAADIQRAINYLVRQMIDAKETGKLYDSPISFLDEIKDCNDRMIKDSGLIGNLNLQALYDFNNQILGIVNEKYQIS